MTSPRSGFRLPFLSRARAHSDVEAELDFHLDMVAGELEANGWSRTEAELEARRRFGDIEFTRNYCGLQDLRRQKEGNRMARIDEIGKDLRYTLRSLRNAPGFVLIVLLTLALGIGANTSIFSVVRAVLLEPLPFADADRLVRVWHVNPSSGATRGLVSEPDFRDWKRESRTAESMGAYWYADGLSGVDYTGDERPVRMSSALVADGFFETLGTPPYLGRVIGSEDQLAGRNRVAVLGYGTWRTRFRADAGMLGRAIQLNGEAFTVIGVMPEHFAFPADRDLDVWIPLSVFDSTSIGRARASRFQSVIARLAPGATQAQLLDELSSLASQLSRDYPENAGWNSVSVMSLRESMVGNVQRPLVLLMGAVFLVLLITCANIASLLLARATSRQRELAVRAALGAGRWRITRQLLTESLALALAGGVLGGLLAYWLIQIVATHGTMIPRTIDLGLDSTVLAFTLGISVLAGLIFGVAPSIRAAGTSLESALRAGGRGNVGAGTRLRHALVVTQVALAVVLVMMAALTTKSFTRLLAVDMGFEPNNALHVETSLGARESREVSQQLYQDVLSAIRATPGVEAVGAIRDLPTIGRGEISPVVVAGTGDALGDDPLAQYHQISSDYFRAMRIPLRNGRVFDERDRAGAPLVVIVNEEFVRRILGGGDALTRVLLFGELEIPIVGVVGDVRQGGAAEAVEPAVYLHIMQSFRNRMSIVVRTFGDPLDVANALRQAIWTVDRQQTITRVESLETVLGQSVARPRLLASLFALFGVLGLSLGALGIYGVLAFSVTQRQQEIGVRMALGASPRSVRGMVVKQGLLLALVGVALGIVGALATTGAIQAVLFDIEAVDVPTFAQVALAVTGTAFLASWIPARRATTIDPVVALRDE